MFSDKMFVHMARENLVKIQDHCRFTALQLLKAVESHVTKSNMGEELQKSWHDLIVWTEFLNQEVCDECAENITLKNPEQARDLLEKISLSTTGNTEVLMNISALKDSFKFWGT